MNLRDSLRASIALGVLEKNDTLAKMAWSADFTGDEGDAIETLMEIVREWADADERRRGQGEGGSARDSEPEYPGTIPWGRAAYKEV